MTANDRTARLDRLIPLTHSRLSLAVDIGVDIPMRYAECYLVMHDGTRARLKSRGQLLGWAGPEHRRSFFFKAGEQVVRVRTDANRRRPIRAVEICEHVASCFATSTRYADVVELEGTVDKVTSPDGRLLFLTTVPSRARGAAPHSERPRVPATGPATSLAAQTA